MGLDYTCAPEWSALLLQRDAVLKALEAGKERGIENPLDRSITQMCEKHRFLELIHDFIVFDAGIKKTCRTNQYFGTKATREFCVNREGGIVWHTQGSG